LCLFGYLKRNLSQNIQQRRLISFREERDENILILGSLFVNMFKSYLTIYFFCWNNAAYHSKIRK